jgi:hypothetical protein
MTDKNNIVCNIEMDLTKLSKTELLAKCEEIGITKCKSKNKGELIEIIKSKQNISLPQKEIIVEVNDLHHSSSDNNIDVQQNMIEYIYENTCLQNMISNDGTEHFSSLSNSLNTVKVIYARCKKSMFLLDTIHRDYVNKHIFNKGDILAIKSVAGNPFDVLKTRMMAYEGSKKRGFRFYAS